MTLPRQEVTWPGHPVGLLPSRGLHLDRPSQRVAPTPYPAPVPHQSLGAGAHPPRLSGSCAFLDSNRRKARYGVTYVRNLCAQAGVGFEETSPDEDVLAVDCEVKFVEASVRVQVKCTSSLKATGRSASWPVEEGWLRKWADSRLPVYIVVVMVSPESDSWIEHRRKDTLHNTAAFWVRVDGLTDAKRVRIPKANRLQSSTFTLWRNEMLAGFIASSAGDVV